MTNMSQKTEIGAGVGVSLETSVGVNMEVVGVGREGVVESVLEKTMSPEIQYMGHIAYGVVAPVIISFGILTNVLNLVVLTRPSLRGPTFRYLKWLAVANLLVCVVLLPFTLHSHATPVPYPAALYFAHVEVPVGNALIASSVYIVVGLSIDRFVAVCFPRNYRNLHSHYVASLRIALSFIMAFIMYIPMAFHRMVVPAAPAYPGRYLIKENLRVVSARWFLVYEYLLEICVRFAPAILLAVLNTWIIIEFKRISRRRQLLSRGFNCEVSAVPSQSYFEGNPVSTVVNHSPVIGQGESLPDPTRASNTAAPDTGTINVTSSTTRTTNIVDNTSSIYDTGTSNIASSTAGITNVVNNTSPIYDTGTSNIASSSAGAVSAVNNISLYPSASNSATFDIGAKCITSSCVETSTATPGMSAVTTPSTAATYTVTSFSEISPSSQESRMESSLSKVSCPGNGYKASHNGNGYKYAHHGNEDQYAHHGRRDEAGLGEGERQSTRNSSAKSSTRSRDRTENIGLSTINVSGKWFFLLFFLLGGPLCSLVKMNTYSYSRCS
ncbi:dopamine D2-like receptor [Cherax quadricarinatus]|uniref:dopamine D2-like receptor n=1 Tax=Cherax quadricarinatus TaxID=27406 RepID=UPI00387E5962